jgi:hypothetical protein
VRSPLRPVIAAPLRKGAKPQSRNSPSWRPSRYSRRSAAAVWASLPCRQVSTANSMPASTGSTAHVSRRIPIQVTDCRSPARG